MLLEFDLSTTNPIPIKVKFSTSSRYMIWYLSRKYWNSWPTNILIILNLILLGLIIVYFGSPKGPSSQGNGFSSGHVWMWELDCEEGWALKNWCFWTVVLEKTLESRLDCKEIQPVHSEGNQPWDFFGTNDAKAETPVLWPPHTKSWLIGKDSDAGRDWGQEEKGTTEDEMAGWHHQLNGHRFEWTPGDGDGQGGLACCNSWGCRVEHNWATELNWTEWLMMLNILSCAYLPSINICLLDEVFDYFLLLAHFLIGWFIFFIWIFRVLNIIYSGYPCLWCIILLLYCKILFSNTLLIIFLSMITRGIHL